MNRPFALVFLASLVRCNAAPEASELASGFCCGTRKEIAVPPAPQRLAVYPEYGGVLHYATSHAKTAGGLLRFEVVDTQPLHTQLTPEHRTIYRSDSLVTALAGRGLATENRVYVTNTAGDVVKASIDKAGHVTPTLHPTKVPGVTAALAPSCQGWQGALLAAGEQGTLTYVTFDGEATARKLGDTGARITALAESCLGATIQLWATTADGKVHDLRVTTTGVTGDQAVNVPGGVGTAQGAGIFGAALRQLADGSFAGIAGTAGALAQPGFPGTTAFVSLQQGNSVDLVTLEDDGVWQAEWAWQLDPLPPPTPKAPEIVKFQSDSKDLWDGSKATFTWKLASCEKGCSLTLKGVDHESGEKLFEVTGLRTDRGITLRPAKALKADVTLTVVNAVGTTTSQPLQLSLYHALGWTPPPQTFFFRLDSKSSTVASCVMYAVAAADGAWAKSFAEQMYGGYAAREIEFAEYVQGCPYIPYGCDPNVPGQPEDDPRCKNPQGSSTGMGT